MMSHRRNPNYNRNFFQMKSTVAIIPEICRSCRVKSTDVCMPGKSQLAVELLHKLEIGSELCPAALRFCFQFTIFF